MMEDIKTYMKILKAGAEDAAEIARLNDAVQKMHADHHPDVFKYPTDASEIEKFFHNLLTADSNVIFIAVDSGRRIGYVWCTIEWKQENPFKYGQDRIYIHQIAVDAAYRRKGVGRRIIQAVEGLAKENNINSIVLDSWEFNQEAQTFFEHLGFSGYNINMWRQMGKG